MNTPAVPSAVRVRSSILLSTAVTLALAACGTGAPGSPASPVVSPDASPGSVATPATEGIEHGTDPTDIVFRFEEGGGFVPMGFFATEAPIFTLYGDGTVIFKDGNAAPPPEADGIIRTTPYRIVTLTEGQLQVFLRTAISDGGLGVARANYGSVGADLPTATFTINAGGTTKTVSVMALGMEREPGPDTLILQALAGLGERIRDFSREVDGDEAWVPDRWRGVLTPDAFNPPRAWPWPNVPVTRLTACTCTLTVAAAVLKASSRKPINPAPLMRLFSATTKPCAAKRRTARSAMLTVSSFESSST